MKTFVLALAFCIMAYFGVSAGLDGGRSMGTFIVVAIGIVLVAFVVYVVATVRLERAIRREKVIAPK